MAGETPHIEPRRLLPGSPFFRAEFDEIVLEDLDPYVHDVRGRPTFHRKVRAGVIPERPQVPPDAFFVTKLTSRNRRLALRRFPWAVGEHVTPLENAFWWIGIDDPILPSRVLLIPSWVSMDELVKAGRSAIIKAVLGDNEDDGALSDTAQGVIIRRARDSFAVVDTTVTAKTTRKDVIQAVLGTKGANRFFVQHPIRLRARTELYPSFLDSQGEGESDLRVFDRLLILRQVAQWTLTGKDEARFTLPDELLFEPDWLHSYELRDSSNTRSTPASDPLESDSAGSEPDARVHLQTNPSGSPNLNKAVLARRLFSVHFDDHVNIVLKYLS